MSTLGANPPNLITAATRAGSTRAFKPGWRLPLPIVIFLASSIVTLLFWSVLPARLRLTEATDYYVFYEPVARSILAGNGFDRGGDSPASAFPPGYPLILAGVFGASHQLHVSEELGLALLSLVSMGLSTLFVFLLARSFWGTSPAIVSALLWTTYPFALWLTKQPNTEMPFAVLLYGGFYLFGYLIVRRKLTWLLYLLCGLIFGAAMLVRPIAIGIAFVLALIIWLARQDLSRRLRLLVISVLLLGNVAAVFPWEAFVYARTGRVILLSGHGTNSLRLGLTFALDERKDIRVSRDVDVVMKDIAARSDEINSFRDVVSVVAVEFRAHPVATTTLYLLKVVRSWYATDSGRYELPILLLQLPYLGFSLWSVRRLWKNGGRQRYFAMSVLLFVIYFWSMTVLALSILRYMVPVMGLLFIAVGAALFPAAKLNAQISKASQRGAVTQPAETYYCEILS
jgi:4-amino-4-deoxy-L-arabinose transferase-like glycosyltransferase